MRKRLLTLLTLVLGVCSGVWATTELVYYDVTGITVSGTTATMSSGLTITQSNSKNLASGSNITVSGTARKSFKFSTGSRNLTFTAPSGSEITAITAYTAVNNAATGGGCWSVSSPATEISATAGTLFTANNTKWTTPDIQKFAFEPASSITMKWTGNQLCAVFEIEYFTTSTSKYTLTTAASPAAGSATISAARSYYAGSTTYLTTTSATGYAFTNWTDESSTQVSATASFFGTMPSANTTYTANFEAATTYTITGEVASGQSAYGHITNSGDNVITENSTITFEATSNTGYGFVNWTLGEGGSEYSTNASITVTATANATYTANFKKLYTVSYDIDDYKGTSQRVLNNFSVSVNETYAGVDNQYTIPSYAHRYLYREGYRLTGWQDQDDNSYATGSTYTLTKDITLTPVWTATTQTLANSSSEKTVTWNFSNSQILFNNWQGGGYVGYYTKPLEGVNGETIAVPMIVDATSGKVNNLGRSDALAQTNKNTKFTIPAVNGMTVVIANAYTAFSTTTVAGSTSYTKSDSDKTLTYTYTGSDETIDIIIGEDNQYLTTISVTYPAMTTAATITSAGWATLYTDKALDFSGVSGLTAYTATCSGSTVTLTPVNDVPANTGVVLKGSADTYYIPTTESSSTDKGHLLGSALAATAYNAYDGYTLYVLTQASDGVNVEFNPVTSGEIAAGKAFLKVSSGDSSLAPTLNVVFAGGTTGIDSAVKSDELRDKSYYNLAGQRVAQPTKGLYIVGGKKVVVK